MTPEQAGQTAAAIERAILEGERRWYKRQAILNAPRVERDDYGTFYV